MCQSNKPGPILGVMHFPEAQTGARRDGGRQAGSWAHISSTGKGFTRRERSWMMMRPMFGTRPKNVDLDISVQSEMVIWWVFFMSTKHTCQISQVHWEFIVLSLKRSDFSARTKGLNHMPSLKHSCTENVETCNTYKIYSGISNLQLWATFLK